MTVLGFYISMAVFWLIVAVIFIIIEGLTMGLTTIWFAGGAAAALAAALFDAAIMVQIVVFIIVSVVCLVFTRKIFVKKLHTGQEKTNVDALIGAEAVVISEIKPFEPGIVKLRGQEWTAICIDDDAVLQSGQKVIVERIEGVKAVVSPLNK